jgi:hypothetical protein
MARPQETFKKREKDMKRREKRERKENSAASGKKALAQKGEATQPPEDLPDDSQNGSGPTT